jgi:hypothetical protein
MKRVLALVALAAIDLLALRPVGRRRRLQDPGAKSLSPTQTQDIVRATPLVGNAASTVTVRRRGLGRMAGQGYTIRTCTPGVGGADVATAGP